MNQLTKKVFRSLPFKRTAFHFIRAVYRPPESPYLYFSGDFSIQLDDGHSFRMRHYGFQIENELFWSGVNGWEKTSLPLWVKLVRRSEAVFDIGANTGVYSLIAKSINPAAQVFAFEPVERVFEKLETNISINGFDVASEKAGLSNTDGVATIYDTGADHILSVTVNKNLNAAKTPVVPTEIKTIRLDSYIEQKHIEKIDHLKIDVETHEPEVLEGFGKYLNEFRPTMLVEVLNDDVGKRIESRPYGLDYLYFNIDETSNSIRLVDSIGKSDYYNFLIWQRPVAEDLGLV